MRTSSAVGVDDNTSRSLAKHAETCRLELFAEMCYSGGGGKEKQSGTKAKVQGRAKTSVPTKLT